MRVKIKEKIISHSIHVMVSILMLLGFSLYTTSATANGIQLQIFEAGLALGRAQALLTFIGSDNPNAATAINTRFGEAATAIQAYRSFESRTWALSKSMTWSASDSRPEA